MVGVADDIVAAGAEIIWVMERTASNAPGTAVNCQTFMSTVGGGTDKGWCVGDSETLPTAYTFDNSPFSLYRGFDMIVTKNDMVIQFSSSHGSPAGNENMTGAEMLAEVQAVIAGLNPPTP
ncbi:MAG: hypothetical protein KC656_08600 [Myxococcales bacterium]|nr:hypothetical protein [Myxococcales bacterium]MCB9671703.1 hypothetical protein [Alphaproteobacteria bacterium]MCB9692018.1 hypothetical protein [Alphaproteobacteria bacterium]